MKRRIHRTQPKRREENTSVDTCYKGPEDVSQCGERADDDVLSLVTSTLDIRTCTAHVSTCGKRSWEGRCTEASKAAPQFQHSLIFKPRVSWAFGTAVQSISLAVIGGRLERWGCGGGMRLFDPCRLWVVEAHGGFWQQLDRWGTGGICMRAGVC
jgi:hypothetical protein